jgi:hypothetical protein
MVMMMVMMMMIQQRAHVQGPSHITPQTRHEHTCMYEIQCWQRPALQDLLHRLHAAQVSCTIYVPPLPVHTCHTCSHMSSTVPHSHMSRTPLTLSCEAETFPGWFM